MQINGQSMDFIPCEKVGNAVQIVLEQGVNQFIMQPAGSKKILVYYLERNATRTGCQTSRKDPT
jgi:hypothetical protein